MKSRDVPRLSSESGVQWPDDTALAAFRAWLQGLNARVAVTRYLGSASKDEGRPAGASARGVVGGIRRQLIAIARHKKRFDLAALLEDRGLAPSSEKERQQILNAIETLRHLPVPRPQITDPVSDWLAPRTVSVLQRAGIHTLADLTVRIPRRRMWWVAIPSLGRRGAKVVVEFFALHPQLTERARSLIRLGTTQELAPWEVWCPPDTLDGSAGFFRAPKEGCMLSATNDYEAVQAWLSLQESQSTHRAYRKEVERLMLWAIVERGKALSSLTPEDAVAYRAFLRRPAPRERWVGPSCPRISSSWKPFAGPLSARSIAYGYSVLAALFRWLIAQRYLVANPFAGIKVRGATHKSTLDAGKSFSDGEWAVLRAVADGLERRWGWSVGAAVRLRFILDFGRATGLRREELVGLKLGQIEISPANQRWINVVGKGHKAGRVVLPPLAWDALSGYLRVRGIAESPHRWNPITPLIGVLINDAEEQGNESLALGMSASRLGEILKRFFATAENALGDDLSPHFKSKLQKASAHWLRHTHATHALNSGVDLRAVRDNLRHASIATTSVYLHTTDEQRTKEFALAFK